MEGPFFGDLGLGVSPLPGRVYSITRGCGRSQKRVSKVLGKQGGAVGPISLWGHPLGERRVLKGVPGGMTRGDISGREL